MSTTVDIDRIGDVEMLLPRRIQAGLAANDRLKYFLTLLQTAVAHARTPDVPASSLLAAREAAGVDDAEFDQVVERSRPIGDTRVLVPHAAQIRAALFGDLREMLAPVASAAQLMPDLQDAAEGFDQRLGTLDAQTPRFDDDQVDVAAVEHLAAPRSETRDTVHQLVMDLHQQLLRLQARIPVHDVDGACTWGLTPNDEIVVRAFMQGLGTTAPLKFDHPGLETSAARAGERLSIQNDLGTTDAHVVVLHVDGLTVTVVYSDIHRRRVAFLQTLLEGKGIVWDAASGGIGTPILLVGRMTADNADALAQFLSAFASRLVFLIDWNRARKQLMRFVRKSEAVSVLRWAAEHGYGHRAFLQAGGAGLVYTALERIASRHAVPGGRLDECLGRADASHFLCAALRLACTSLRAGRSTRVIQDEIEAELLMYLEDGGHNGLTLASEHATYVSALAERFRRVVGRREAGPAFEEAARGATLASRWLAEADEIVRRRGLTAEWSAGGALLRRLFRHAGAAADAMEEAAFLLTLVPSDTAATTLETLEPLADRLLAASRDYVRAVEHARPLLHAHGGPDLDELLILVDRLGAHERSMAQLSRETLARQLTDCRDFREWHALSGIAQAAARAGRALGNAGLAIRDYVLTGVGRQS